MKINQHIKRMAEAYGRQAREEFGTPFVVTPYLYEIMKQAGADMSNIHRVESIPNRR